MSGQAVTLKLHGHSCRMLRLISARPMRALDDACSVRKTAYRGSIGTGPRGPGARMRLLRT